MDAQKSIKVHPPLEKVVVPIKMIESKKIEENKKVFDTWAPKYDINIFQFWMKKFHRPVFQEINLEKKSRIIDLSCGTGELLQEIKKKDTHHNISLKGIDLSPKMLDIARKKLPTTIILGQQNVLGLKEKNNTYDYVISTEAFHHYPDQKKALQEMMRIAKKEAKIIVVDINFFLRPIHWLFETFEPGCVYINSRQEMKTLFEQAGLKQITQKRSFLFAVMTIGVKL